MWWPAARRRGAASAYWPGGSGAGPRIVFTAGQRLIAIDAASGQAAAAFGKNGEVDLGVPYNSVPLVHDNVIVVGANTPPMTPGGIGNARAFDARSGAKLWEFSSVPQPGHVGHDTWEGDSWKDRLGVNAWPFYFTRRRGARHAVHPARVADSGVVGRRPRRREPVRQLGRRRGPSHRQVQVALPDDPPRPVGRRSAGAAGPVRHRQRRPDHSCARRHHQVGLSLSPEPRDRCSRSTASRSARSPPATYPGERAFPTQPIPGEAAGNRARGATDLRISSRPPTRRPNMRRRAPIS